MESLGYFLRVKTFTISLQFFENIMCSLKKHKDGCQCAICVMMRRRQEREEIARLVGGPTYVSDDSLGEDIKTEVFI